MSSDYCLDILLAKARGAEAQGLWLLDENAPIEALPNISNSACAIITNRYHVFAAAKQNKLPVYYSDFDFSPLAADFPSQVYYRVSKEKALTHFLINQAFLHLPLGGCLHLCGLKNDGIKSYIDKAAKLFGTLPSLENHDQSAKCACLIKQQANGSLLDDKDYQIQRTIFELQGKPVLSKPGVFGWNKQDAGSALLVEHLGEVLKTCERPISKLLDLGCGYGYISLQAFYRYPELAKSEFLLTDNNIAAVTCANLNLQTHGIHGSALSDDCGSEIQDSFNLILCNPPFHQGFDVSEDITRHFLHNTSRLLSRSGKALFVVNQFVGLEKKSADFFSGCWELARNKSFKIILLDKPKAHRTYLEHKK